MKRTSFALALAAATMPSAVIAQAPERTSFYLVNGTDTVIAERFTRTATSLSGEFVDRLRGGRMVYNAVLAPNGLITRLTTEFYRTADDTACDHASFVIDGDSVIATMGDAAPAHLPAAPGTMVFVNPSVAFIEQLVVRARAMGGARATMPILMLGAPQPLSSSVTWVGSDSATLEYGGLALRLAVSREGRIHGGEASAKRVALVRSTANDAPLAALRDYSAPRSAPYISEDVVITTRLGIKLAGTITIPRGRVGGRAPAVVTITGSGPEDRDGEPQALRGYRPFRELADTLGKRGIAVLRLDDRGVNGSTAGPAWATSRDFAEDIRAAVMYLRRRPEIDATRIALVGHSEGAMIAPMVAKTDGQLRGMVLMAGAASTGRDVLSSQQHYMIDTVAKLTGAARTQALERYRRATDSTAKATPWMKFFVEYEPATMARQVETPVLILHGETDHQVPASEAERLADAFRTAGNHGVSVRLFPQTNHLFVADTSGSFDYAKLPSLRVRREVLGAIADWLHSQFQ